MVPAGRVLLGYPVGFSETEPFAISVRRLVTHEFMKPDSERVLAGTKVAPGLYVEDNRNELAASVLDYPHVEWLLQIDTDIEFLPDVLDRMLFLAESQNIKILAASVPIGDTYPTAGFLIGDADKPGTWKCLAEIPPEPIEVDGIATAIAMIHRDVLLDIARKHGRCWFTRIPLITSPPDTPMEQKEIYNQGEDFSFCLRAREVGHSIWCAHVPGFRHWKMKGYTHDASWPERPRSRRGGGMGLSGTA
jgi:hypothetical protein